MRRLVAFVGLSVLTACGDPLADFDQYSDLKISEETRPIANALPSVEELARTSGPLSDLVTPKDPVDVTPPESEVVAAVLEPETAADSPAQPEKRGGLLAWLTRQAPKPVVTETTLEPLDASVTPEAPAEPVAEPEEDKPKIIVPPLAEAETEDAVEEEEGKLASLSPDEAVAAAVEEPKEKKRKGLFSRPAKAKPKLSQNDTTYGTILPFGEVGRVCEARSQPLGQRVAKSENRGQTYTLYDSAPDSAAQRTFYVTGFSDKCPRQFTAAVALFGMPSMHEKLRYGQPSKQYPYSATDKAYEKIKSRICGVSAGKPCGGKIETLERDTVFISTYENFTGSARWADVLIHDSTVMATAIKKIGDPTQ